MWGVVCVKIIWGSYYWSYTIENHTIGFFLNERSHHSAFQMVYNKSRGNYIGRDNLEEKKWYLSKFQKVYAFNDRIWYSSDLDFFFCLMFAFCFLSFLMSKMALFRAGDWNRHFDVFSHQDYSMINICWQLFFSWICCTEDAERSADYLPHRASIYPFWLVPFPLL